MAAEKFLSEAMIKKLGFTPTDCQKQLFETLGAFVMDNPALKWLLMISGYAGTGKTTAIGAFIGVLETLKYKYVLVAPTGRSAKVLANYTGKSAKTIHKQIYRQKSLSDGIGQFSLDVNKSKNTFYIVDEASLLTNGYNSSSSLFGSGDLLDDLISYVRQDSSNRLILMGDPAQLPPIGMERSPALDPDNLKRYVTPVVATLRSVVRQEKESGILKNATLLRTQIENEDDSMIQFDMEGYDDISRIAGGDLIECIGDAIDKYGLDDTVVLCRSNNRANRYNMGIRQSVLSKEEQLSKGDKLMIVKNCYQFLEEVPELDFIANGDVAELMKISHYEERYNLHYATATLAFPDYNNIEITAKIILDTLLSTSPALSQEQQKMLFEQVYEDYSNVKGKRARIKAVREDLYFNALQVKYAAAITCHKSQGGQWKCVFIDNCFWNDDITVEDKKWLYTAITRGVERVYLVNFKDYFFSCKK
jgi:exodeoxyribonuclease V